MLAYVLPPMTDARAKRSWQHAVALSGMRGALPVALVLALPAALPHRGDLVAAVYGVVFISLVVQGLAAGPILGRLAVRT